MTTTLRVKSLLRQRRSPRQVWQIFVLAATLALVSATAIASFEGYSLYQYLLATILLIVSLYPTARYFAHHESGVPLFAVLCLAYAAQFAVPIFVSNPQILLAGAEIRDLEDSHVVAALWLSVLGVVGMESGYYALQSGKFAGRVPVIDLHLNEKKAVVYC